MTGSGVRSQAVSLLPRRLGQHFLADGSYAARIVRAAHISTDDMVVEVGPGRGALTNIMVQQRPRFLLLVEFDPELADGLKRRYAGHDWVRVVEGDARTVDPAHLPGIEDVPYKLVGNLPYYAASPIVRNFLESSRPPTVMVVMVQKEVAAEMTALPGEMGLLSIGVQTFADAERLFDVPPSAFRPPPKVVSAVVRLTALAQPRVELGSRKSFFELVRAGFRAPRKQMRNSLMMGLEITGESASSVLVAAGVDASRRAATLSLDEWGALYGAWRVAPSRTPDAVTGQ
ncbi:MAG: ribosomal RNA small subunit methyltransferase A [Dehalococcoidia bacterium]|nr:ribosomal RNA small subunit methyltransferase A [Dehalococcoidia bacterium]MSQ35152.1 ribosomal RNA small subunit methyltransferase A [Dehalococcoidia bacterium]